MNAKTTRLDRLVSKHLGISTRNLRLLFAQKRIRVNGSVEMDRARIVNQFHLVHLDDKVIQQNVPYYFMVNKPAGIVSATTDSHHQTVIDLIDHPAADHLHIVGRLDFNSTGLILLTNDGQWSRKLACPTTKTYKHYRVTLENALTQEYISAFSKGMYFQYEGLVTRPAKLKIIDSHTADVALTEGRYHQIKRMFGRFQNRVTHLHRYAVGNIKLDVSLKPGQYRALEPTEIEYFKDNNSFTGI